MKHRQEVEVLSIFVHGCLVALHALGIAYNIRRKNKFDCVAHTSAMIYDAWAVAKHAKRLKKWNGQIHY